MINAFRMFHPVMCVCGSGWFILCALIAQCTTAVAQHGHSLSLIRLTRASWDKPLTTHTLQGRLGKEEVDSSFFNQRRWEKLVSPSRLLLKS